MKCLDLIPTDAWQHFSRFFSKKFNIMPITASFIKQPAKIANKASKFIKTVYLNRTARIHPEPIIVMGSPKSGTTVIASLLGGATGKKVIIDPFYRIKNSVNLRQKLQEKEITFGNLIQKHKYYFAPEIIKDPYLIFLYEECLECFQEAKFIFISREPRDNIRSILNRLKLPGNLQILDDRDLDTLPDESAWKLVLRGELPVVAGDNYIEKLAHRWNLATDIYMAHKDKIVLIRYEDFLKNKSEAITNLARQMGVEQIYDISEKVNVQYQPRGDRNVDFTEFFGTDNLRRIETICGDRMKYFDY